MKLQMLYDLNDRPSTAYLAEVVSAQGYDSYSPITDADYNIIGNLWHDPENPDRTDFSELQNILSAEHPGAEFAIVD